MYPLRIAEFRKRAGMTQRQMAGILGVTPQYLSDMERGKRYFHHWHEEVIVKTLDLTPDEADQMIGLRPYRTKVTV